MAGRSGTRQVLVLLICAGFTCTFAYHALKGRHGLEARYRLAAQAVRLEQTLAGLEAVRAGLERDNALLDPARLDPDMLDEQTRSVLGYAGPRDIVLLQP